MRRFFPIVIAAIAVATFGCHDATLAPVQTVDGPWSGVQNGYSLSFSFTQTDTVVAGAATLTSVAGSFEGTATGTFKYPKLSVTVHVEGFQDAKYDGTMSGSEAKIFGVLNGSGINNVEVDVRKR